MFDRQYPPLLYAPHFSLLHNRPAFVGLSVIVSLCSVQSNFMASASSSKPEAIKLQYDVYINHRGPDTKHTVAATIYNTLHAAGFRVFLGDSEDLYLGDFFPQFLMEVILNASIHIAILSKNSAKSPWCLAELSLMLETGKTVIPIFYHVRPSDLRFVISGRGSYADALDNYSSKNRYSPETLYKWMRALHNVADLSGLEIANFEDESRLPKEIVTTISTLMKKVPSGESKYPVGPDETLANEVSRKGGEYFFGLDATVCEFEKYASQSPQSHQDKQIVGIVGMGGCGKTTLAKEFYEKKRRSFDGSSFISEVRKVSKIDLPELQKQLLKDLLPDLQDFPIDDINDVVAQSLRSRRVLIVWDEIEYDYQLEALMARKNALGPGSLIIITTRDKGILTDFDESTIIYEMKPLVKEHAKQLFSWHAFNEFSPLPEFEDLVGKFLNACNGLPLTLTVLGGLLRGKERDFWESQSQKISRLLPEDIQQRLKLSYDVLDKERKAIFLDIACFYVGKDKDLTISVWNQSGWKGERSLEILVDKSLVELDNRNRIKMHSQLRDLGRKIALRQTPCRLFSDEAVKDYTDDEFDKLFQSRVRDNQNNLVACKTRGDCIKNVDGNLTRHLIWVEWHDYRQSSMPSGILLENLRILHLRNVFFNRLWLHDAKLPKRLEELNISGSIGEFPKSIVQMEHLIKIVVDGYPNTSLKALPAEFCLLKSLEHLTLRWCRALASLPRHFGNLTRLRHLDLALCDGLKELPHSFEQLLGLRHLDFQGCEKLVISPHFLGEISGLERLSFMDCRNLKALPAEVPCQKFLTRLNLVGTSLERLPNEVGRLVNLEVLEIGSRYLTDLPIAIGNMTNLRTLNLKDCKNLRCLPDISGLRSDLSIEEPEHLKTSLEI